MVEVLDPSALTADAEYLLDGSAEDILRLSDDLVWQSTACPQLSGSVSVHDVTTDVGGLTTSLAATFELHCTPQHAVYGSLGFGSTAPALPAGADALIAAESRYPSLASVFDGISANTLALTVRHRKVLLRWDTPVGFGCAEVAMEESNGTPVLSYAGRDDTLTAAELDPTHTYQIMHALDDSSANSAPDFSAFPRDYVYPVTTSLEALPEAVIRGEEVSFHGRVTVPLHPGAEAALFVDVIIRGRKADGSIMELGSTATDQYGKYSITTKATRTMRIWSLVPPGDSAPAPGVMHHFGDSSERYTLHVARR